MLTFPRDFLALQNLPNGLDLSSGLGESRILTSPHFIFNPYFACTYQRLVVFNLSVFSFLTNIYHSCIRVHSRHYNSPLPFLSPFQNNHILLLKLWGLHQANLMDVICLEYLVVGIGKPICLQMYSHTQWCQCIVSINMYVFINNATQCVHEYACVCIYTHMHPYL